MNSILIYRHHPQAAPKGGVIGAIGVEAIVPATYGVTSTTFRA
jgi:hypothetical protein